jgi:hypothetical protein
MGDVVGAQPPGWLRIVAVLALLWNLIGVYFYLTRVGVVGAAGPTPEMAGGQMWFTAAFAISVFGGTIGCLGLLLLKSWARSLLVLSLLAVLAQDYAVLSAGVGGKELAMPALVTAIAVVLAWLSHTGVKRGWLS